MTTYVENNSKKYVSFHVPNFGITVGKNSIHPFVRFRITWVANLTGYFVGDVGGEVLGEKNTQLSMIIFAPMMVFLATFFPFSRASLLAITSFLLNHAPQNF